jgi:hypothetical protein
VYNYDKISHTFLLSKYTSYHIFCIHMITCIKICCYETNCLARFLGVMMLYGRQPLIKHFIFRSNIYLRYFLYSQNFTHISSQDNSSASTHTISFVHLASLSATNKTLIKFCWEDKKDICPISICLK